jgi:hypothetical protein
MARAIEAMKIELDSKISTCSIALCQRRKRWLIDADREWTFCKTIQSVYQCQVFGSAS